MAGTVTTTVISGVEPHQYAEGKVGTSGTAIHVGDLVREKAGSVGSIQPVLAGGSAAGVNVAVEYGSVERGGSYKTDEKILYVKAQPGDILNVNADGTTTAISAGNLLTAAPSAGTAGHFGKGGNGTLAVSRGAVTSSAQGTIEVQVV